jgi:hypothetical protein
MRANGVNPTVRRADETCSHHGQGVHIGRPRVPVDADQAKRALAKAGSIRGAARLLRVDESLVRRRLAS